MSTSTKTPTKAALGPTSPEKDKDTMTVEANLIPLFIAALGTEHVGNAIYKKMAQMNPGGRSISSYEHWFRHQKEKARQILAANPSMGTEGGTPVKEKKAVKPRKPKAGMLTEDSGEGTGDVDGNMPVKEKKVPKSRKRKAEVSEEDDGEESEKKHVKTEEAVDE